MLPPSPLLRGPWNNNVFQSRQTEVLASLLFARQQSQMQSFTL